MKSQKKAIQEQLDADTDYDEQYERHFLEEKLLNKESTNIMENNKNEKKKSFNAKKFFDKCTDAAEIKYVRGGTKDPCVQIDWSVKGTGFGELYIYKEDGEWKIDSETMGKKFTKKILSILVDSIETIE